MILVVDASVAIKWFVREPGHDDAVSLLKHAKTLYAPDLLVAEVSNIAWKKAVRAEITESQAAEIAHAIRQGTPLLYPSTMFNERALVLAFHLGHSVYDCLYLACAEAIDGILVTADDKFHKTASKAGFADRLRRLDSANHEPSPS